MACKRRAIVKERRLLAFWRNDTLARHDKKHARYVENRRESVCSVIDKAQVFDESEFLVDVHITMQPNFPEILVL